MFSLAYNLPKTMSNFCPLKLQRAYFEIISIKVRENNVDFLTIEIISKGVRGNNVDFSTIKIISKKVRGNNVEFSTIEVTSKKYMEMTWKFVEIWSSIY